jgi:DNA repair photolyase
MVMTGDRTDRPLAEAQGADDYGRNIYQQLRDSSLRGAGSGLAVKQRSSSSARIPTIDKAGSNEEASETPFDGNAPELTTTWSSYAQVICCVNSYRNGITVSLHSGPSRESPLKEQEAVPETDKPAEQQRKYLPNQFHLRVRDTRDFQLPEGKYFLYRKDLRAALEHHLSQLNQRGLLASTVVYFGTTTDPFVAFHKKFDVTTACLELFGQYKPGRLVVQTRSPMIIAALPTLKFLGNQAVAAIPIETHLERSVARYTPGMPRIAERLVAAQGLRRQGVAVNITVSPVLPYGDSYRDAWDFAELLNRHADYITFGCLADGSEANEKQLKNLPIAQKLAADQHFRWLRPHAYKHLYQALMVTAPEKLLLPVSAPVKPSQLKLFAA